MIILVILAYFIGSGNLEYILNGEDAIDVAYRTSKVILSGDNEIKSNNDYVFEDTGELKVYFFDVGQADCIFLTNGCLAFACPSPYFKCFPVLYSVLGRVSATIYR